MWRCHRGKKHTPLSATSNVITNLSDSEKDLHSFELLHLLADKALEDSEITPDADSHVAETNLCGLQLLSDASILHSTLRDSEAPENQQHERNCMQSLEKELNEIKTKQLNSTNVKSDKQKLKFYTGFTHPELFDICFNFVTEGQMI